MKNFDKKEKAVSHNDAERAMLDHFYGSGKVPSTTTKIHVTFNKQSLFSMIDKISSLGFEIHQNDFTGEHWIHDAVNKCVVSMDLGNEGRNEKEFSEFLEKSFVYGFTGNESTVNFFISMLRLSEGESTEPTTYEFAEKQQLPIFAEAVSDMGLTVYGNDISGIHFICDSDKESENRNDDSISIIFGDEGKGTKSFDEFQDKSFVHGLRSKNSSLVERIIGHLQIETVEGGQI